MGSRLEICLSCSDLSYCLVRWGLDCKRHGGKKIPRMKSMAAEKVQITEDKSQNQNYKHVNTQTKIKIFEPIRTRVAVW